ncbi:MAG: hypothetical protein LBH13_02980 [Cellulomonadaceae bacterium]|jgi:hypothetical protein|nr:hypothetical protein [Cellulomonadaceae bacterium]
MMWQETALIVVVILAVFGWILVVQARRLDRLHRKVSASRVALDAQLRRRASASLSLARSGLLDPASAVVIADAAYGVIDGEGPATDPSRALAMDGLGSRREAGESALSSALRSALGHPDALMATTVGSELVTDLGAQWYRATLARRFHNEAVSQSVRARRHWYVRWFHLAGRAPMPLSVDLDDTLPRGLPTAQPTSPTTA